MHFTFFADNPLDGYTDWQLDLPDNDGIGGYLRLTIDRTPRNGKDEDTAAITFVVDGNVEFYHSFPIPLTLARRLIGIED